MSRVDAPGNRALAKIEGRPVDETIAELTDPELRPLGHEELLKLSELVPDWSLKVSIRNGASVSHFERTIPKGPDCARAVGNASGHLRSHQDSELTVQIDGTQENEATMTIYVDCGDAPVTPKTIRAIHDVDMQLALNNVFGRTDF